MILESALLTVRDGQAAAFEAAFERATPLITCQRGYRDHELHRCIEHDHQYLLLVRWDNLEDHTVGFRGSAEYPQWRATLHHFYQPLPTVLHHRPVLPA